MSEIFIIFIIFIVGLIVFALWVESSIKKYNITMNVCRYINEQKVRWRLFMRPTSNIQKFIFANKHSVITVDFTKYPIEVRVLNKYSKEENIFVAKYTTGIMFCSEFADALDGIKKLFIKLFSEYTYDTTAEDIIYGITSFQQKITTSGVSVIKEELFEKSGNINHNELSLDINLASEAELTALPGVTIAKAKHAIKVRNKQKLFLTMNQFYEVINLEEEFIEQIQSKGNKVLLSELPEYKRLEMKKETEI